MQGTPRPFIVEVRSAVTKPKLNQGQLLYARLGHDVPSTLGSVLSSRIDTATGAKLSIVANHLPSDSCSVYTQENMRNPHFMLRVGRGWKVR